MTRPLRNCWVLFALLMLPFTARGDDPPKPPGSEAARVYGEWRIRVKPDQGPAYDQLIEKSGLPLFRQAGGRMVGWWKTLIGDLYEHVTIWEYDDMAGFEKAVGFLSKSPEFAKFVAARDPLLIRRGEPVPAAGFRGDAAELARAGALCRARDSPRATCAAGRLSRVHDQARALVCSKLNGFRPVGPVDRRSGPVVRNHLPLLVREPGRARAEDRQVFFEPGREALSRKSSVSSPTRSPRGCSFPRHLRGRPPMPHPRSRPASAGLLPHHEEIAPGFMSPGLPTAITRPTAAGWRSRTRRC